MKLTKSRLLTKTIAYLVAIVMVVGILPSISAFAAPNSGPLKVGINTYNDHQTITGFGTSFHWYSEYAYNNNRSNKDKIYELTFDDTGFNVIRLPNVYGISAGSGQIWGKTRDLATWDKRPLIIEGRKRFENPEDLQILIVPWGIPAELRSATSDKDATPTLKKENGKYVYEKYGQYWVDSIKAYKAADLNPTYICLQNELDITANDGTVFAGTETEDLAGYGEALEAVYNAVQEAFPDNNYIFIGPDSYSGAATAATVYTDHVEEMGNLDMLGGISHHLYSGGSADYPDSYIDNFRTFNRLFPDKLKIQTEYSTYEPINTALVINNFLVEENGSAYLVWDHLWPDTGVIDLENPSNPNRWKYPGGYKITDRFYAMNHFSRYINRGYKRIDSYMNADDLSLRLSAYKSPDEDEVVVVLINSGDEDKTVQLDMNGYNVESSTVYRSVYSNVNGSPVEAMKNIGSMKEGNTVDLPVKGMATVVIKGTPGQNPNILTPSLQQFTPPSGVSGTREPVYALKGTPVVNGEFDASVYSAPYIPVNLLTFPLPSTRIPVESLDLSYENGIPLLSETEQGTAKTYLAWDENFLYAYIDVTDKTNYPATGATTDHTKDNVELFLNESGVLHQTYQQGDYQYRFDRESRKEGVGGFATNQSYFNKVQCVGKNKEDGSGYIVEVRLPFCFGTAFDGKLIGFETQVSNDTTGQGRDTIVHWSDPLADTYIDLTNIGFAFLLDSYDEDRFDDLKSKVSGGKDESITEYITEDGLITGGYFDTEMVSGGEGVVLSANVTATPGADTAYQWQKLDGTVWTDVLGAAEATLKLSGVSLADQYRCVITTTRLGYSNTVITSPVTGAIHYALYANADKALVKNGDYFNIDVKFPEPAPANALSMVITYDNTKFEYRGFTPSGELSSVNIADNDGKLTIMLANTNAYNMASLGSVMFSVRDNVKLKNEDHTITVSAEYVCKDSEDQKVVYSSAASAVISTSSIFDPDKEMTLIDLSNVIDIFGVKVGDENWTKAQYFDFNDNGEIDIEDIVYVAQRIK